MIKLAVRDSDTGYSPVDSLVAGTVTAAPVGGMALTSKLLSGYLDRNAKEINRLADYWEGLYDSNDVLRKATGKGITRKKKGRWEIGTQDTSAPKVTKAAVPGPDGDVKFSPSTGYSAYKSGLSDLETMHSAEVADAAAKEYARGANELLNHRMFGRRVVDLSLAATMYRESAKPSKIGWLPFFKRLSYAATHPDDVFSERGLGADKTVKELIDFAKDHNYRYANTDVNTQAGVNALSTHQNVDVAGSGRGQLEVLFNSDGMKSIKSMKGGKQIMGVLTDSSKSYVDKYKAIMQLKKELGLKDSNTALRMADIVLHGQNPSDYNDKLLKRTKFTTTTGWLRPHQFTYSKYVKTGANDPGQFALHPGGGAEPFFTGLKAHAADARNGASKLSEFAGKLKGASGVLGKWALPAAGIAGAAYPLIDYKINY